jgi:hypothetical protein
MGGANQQGLPLLLTTVASTLISKRSRQALKDTLGEHDSLLCMAGYHMLQKTMHSKQFLETAKLSADDDASHSRDDEVAKETVTYPALEKRIKNMKTSHESAEMIQEARQSRINLDTRDRGG